MTTKTKVLAAAAVAAVAIAGTYAFAQGGPGMGPAWGMARSETWVTA